jgi:hypothetical protein
MEKYFVTYNQALDLKDLGFKESCFGEWRQWDGGYPWLQLYQDLDGCSTDDSDYQYTTEALAPLKSQLFEFFREKYSIVGYVVPHNGRWTYKIISNKINKELNGFKTYEEAESACIDKLIEIIKNK